MKLALVYDWLNTKSGGGENMLIELTKMYPDAPVYTLLYNSDKIGDRISQKRIHTSMLQRAPKWLRRRSRYLLPFVPMAVEQFDLSEYDVVISVSSGWSKGVITKPDTLHICYCYSPMRFVWDYWPQYLNEQHVGPIRRAAIRVLTSRLRVWDYYSSARVDQWIPISKTVAGRINKFYHQPTRPVIYPGADMTVAAAVPADQKEDYFVTLASLTPYKKIDVAIAACNQLKKRLVIMSDGPDRARLEQLAGPTIEFVGRVSNEQRSRLLAGAQALLFPNEEDFGIAPLDAMASGTPVIAYAKGGLTETVVEGKTGILYDDPTVAGLAAAIKRFKASDYEQKDLIAQANKFSLERFRTEFSSAVEHAYKEFRNGR